MKVYVVTYDEHGCDSGCASEILGVYDDITQAIQRLNDCFEERCEYYGVKELNDECKKDYLNFHIESDFADFTLDCHIVEQDLITEDFPITTVCRDDLESIGFDTTNVDDSTMEQLASKMSNAYCDSGFWIDLPICAEALDIPRKEEE